MRRYWRFAPQKIRELGWCFSSCFWCQQVELKVLASCINIACNGARANQQLLQWQGIEVGMPETTSKEPKSEWWGCPATFETPARGLASIHSFHSNGRALKLSCLELLQRNPNPRGGVVPQPLRLLRADLKVFTLSTALRTNKIIRKTNAYASHH